jgi:hypothetical protein
MGGGMLPAGGGELIQPPAGNEITGAVPAGNQITGAVTGTQINTKWYWFGALLLIVLALLGYWAYRKYYKKK